MKNRSWIKRRRTSSSPRKPLSVFARPRRKRKSFTFERLEDRFAFSAAPLEMQMVSLSNDTPEGAAAIWLRELQWAAIQAADAGLGGGGSAEQVMSMLRALPNDPLFASQWHLLNTGQEVGNPDFQALYGVAGEDINVVPVWNMGITGEGVLVAVLDTGVQLFHPDLIANIHPTLRFNAINGSTNVSPSLFDPVSGHGTSVAGLIASTANNNEGGTGVAPGAIIVPMRLGIGLLDAFSPVQVLNALQYALQNGVDIMNHSWGPPDNRSMSALTDFQLQVLRDTVIFGRDGLGMIHVWAAGNGGGPSFSPGFQSFGNYDSAAYDGFVNSRYTIGITGVDHDGLYRNADGTFTSYPEIGPSVLVAAPTGSNFAQNVADDNGQGSGLWTTDLVGDFGFNAAPLPNGFDPDRDLLPDPNYTSRFNGTSGAAPIASGVIALMLEANPNLTYRDVQEILVRSARQNAQFEFPASGGLGELAATNTWQVNQIGPFRNPDPYNPADPRWLDSFTAQRDPIADPNIEFGFGGAFFGPDTNDGSRQFLSHYEPQPALFTNGAGFTVSQGYGIYNEAIGYGHGVIDAEMAVLMAQQWHTLGQNINRQTERTFTTFFVGPVGPSLLPAERMPLNLGGLLVPGGIGSLAGSGYIEWWNEYFADDPFVDYDGRHHSARGASYIDFAVPPSQAMSIEWVEVKLDISGPPEDYDFLRIFLVSPEGTQSELNHFYADPDHLPASLQISSAPPAFIDPDGNLTDGRMVWTFSTNRHWGESSNSVPLIHPVTGEPLMTQTFRIDPNTGLPVLEERPIFRNWELHIENWSNSAFSFSGVEIVWHGKPIAGGQHDPNYADLGIQSAQRVQGFIGIDANNDERFNFNRYVQTLSPQFGGIPHTDVSTIRDSDVVRQLDFNDNNNNGVFDEGDTINQEPFAANIVVEAYRVFNGVAESNPVSRFLTGHDGNYYFDFNVQGDLNFANSIGASLEYEIRIIDPLGRESLRDVDTPMMQASDPQFTYLPHYMDVWRINADWFFAPDRDNPLLLGDNPGEILFDPLTNAPKPFTGATGTLAPVPMAVKNLNFLLKDPAPVNEFLVTGTVYADINGNGKFDGDDAPAAGVFVYWDVDRNGSHNSGEPMVATDAHGQNTLTIPTTAKGTFQIGVIQPTPAWIFTDPGQDGVETVFAGPGSQPQVVNFFMKPPSNAFPDAAQNQPGNIFGVVFNDLNKNGVRTAGEPGLANIRVYIDANENGVWDSGEVSVLTGSNGSFHFANVPPNRDIDGNLLPIRIDVHIENEGTASAAWAMTSPSLGYRQVLLGPGGTVLGVQFGLENRASHDWGDLPDSYRTSAATNGPRHFVVPGFRLGSSIDGEIDGVPSFTASSDDAVGDVDDGVKIISNGGVLQPGVNLVEVTVHGVGGLLTGWIDWDNKGFFNEATDRIIWRDVNGNLLGAEADLNPGTWTLQIIAPAGAANAQLAARFRWGENGLTFFGPATIGEVEDYRFAFAPAGLSGLPGDYNNDGTVDNADFVVWRRNLGTFNTLFNKTTPGPVNQADWEVWRANFGAMAPGAGGGAVAPLAESQSAGEPVATSVDANGVGQSVEVVATEAATETTTVDASPQPLAVPLAVFAGSGSSDGQSSMLASDAAPVSEPSDDLLLLDQAWAELNGEDDEVETLYDRFGHDEEAAGDLELAAVFEDESNWWSI